MALEGGKGNFSFEEMQKTWMNYIFYQIPGLMSKREKKVTIETFFSILSSLRGTLDPLGGRIYHAPLKNSI